MVTTSARVLLVEDDDALRLAQGPDGLTMAELLRRQAREVPIILLTAARSPHERLAGSTPARTTTS